MTQGKEYKIQLCAVADASFWTVHPFYSLNADNLSLTTVAGKPLTVRYTDAHKKQDMSALLAAMGYTLPLEADLSLSLANGQDRGGGSGDARGHAALLPLVAESVALSDPHDLELVLRFVEGAASVECLRANTCDEGLTGSRGGVDSWANTCLFPKTVESFEALLASQVPPSLACAPPRSLPPLPVRLPGHSLPCLC